MLGIVPGIVHNMLGERVCNSNTKDIWGLGCGIKWQKCDSRTRNMWTISCVTNETVRFKVISYTWTLSYMQLCGPQKNKVRVEPNNNPGPCYRSRAFNDLIATIIKYHVNVNKSLVNLIFLHYPATCKYLIIYIW